MPQIPSSISVGDIFGFRHAGPLLLRAGPPSEFLSLMEKTALLRLWTIHSLLSVDLL